MSTAVSHNSEAFTYCDAVLSWGLGAALLVGSIPHLNNPYLFLSSVYAYDLFDVRVGQFVAMFLPTLELVVAITLIAQIWSDAAHLICFALLSCFVTIQSAAYIRGLGISCGCFGPCNETPIGVISLSVPAGLLVLSAVRNALRWKQLTLL